MRVIIHKSSGWGLVFRPFLWAGLSVSLLLLIIGTFLFTSYYVQYSEMIDERLKGPLFPNVSQVYAAPVRLRVGDGTGLMDVAEGLRAGGFTEGGQSPKGRFEIIPSGIRIYPGEDSYFSPEPAEIQFADGGVSGILSIEDQYARNEYFLEPQLITNLFDSSREKRRLVGFRDLPADLLNALLAIEDRRFFEHPGIDFLRLLKAAYIDIRAGAVRQGASTITMQLARSLFLTRDRTIRRKMAEIMVSFQLENRLSKQEILEHYCNTIYLGQRGSFSIQGVGEAAQAYFGKDISELNLPESAFIAGIIQGPNLYSPYSSPERALRRRKVVLGAMLALSYITREEYAEAVDAPLGAVPTNTVASEAPYFVDMVRNKLLERFLQEELSSNSYRIFTTLDLRLQRAAAEAVRIGTEELDQRLEEMFPGRFAVAVGEDGTETAPVKPEVALVALDPKTGAIRALIGGRNYARSQLNRALAMRQPGSIFKPFVYGAAINSYQTGIYEQPWTPSSRIMDEPTTFEFNDQIYEPANYGEHYYGEVTLRYSLMRSLNVATVKLARSIGYETVVSLAHRAGLNRRILPTPAVALGAYEVTPVEMAGAYTIFANEGVRLDPHILSMVRSPGGVLLDITYPRRTRVLEPAVAHVVTTMLQDVVNHGTGIGVRLRGFDAPVAGKTGTSHDGWFAGYSSNLIVVVWVGYDSDRELVLSGASSALPIWTEFMKRARAVPEYANMTAPVAPSGVATVELDPLTGGLATPQCPSAVTEHFIAGSEPREFCYLHFLPPLPQMVAIPPRARAAQAIMGPRVAVPAPPPAPEMTPETALPAPESERAVSPPQPEPEGRKPGFFGRVIGIFGGGD